MKNIVLPLMTLFIAVNLYAQDSPVNIVFDVTSPDPKTHQAVMRHIKLMAENYPDAKFEVVLYSGSYEMVLKDKSTVSNEIEALAKNKNVEFKICALTLKHRELTESDLLNGVGVVPDGILEIALKQKAGWSYIKEAHH